MVTETGLRLPAMLVAALSIAVAAQAADTMPTLDLLLERRAALARQEPSGPPVPGQPSIARQRAAALEAIVGNQDRALALVEALPEAPGPRDLPFPLDGYQALPALDAIAQRAAGAGLLTINEGHNVTAHRALLLALLPRLQAAGYRHVALEGLDREDHDVARRGYALIGRSGAYLRDPVYGEVVRTALRLGFNLVAYDTLEDCDRPDDAMYCLNWRQKAQAEAIAAAVRTDGRGGRVVALVGYSHGALVGTGGFQPMGPRLARLLDLRHASVDQVLLGPRSLQNGKHLAAEVASRLYGQDGPFVLVSADGKDFSPPPIDGQQTMVVFWPNRLLPDGRPAWLARELGRQAVPAVTEACGRARPLLVQAHAEGEPDDATPVDQLLLEGDMAGATLYLPAGRFRLRCERPGDAPVPLGSVTVR